jgi:hypothetical protein
MEGVARAVAQRQHHMVGTRARWFAAGLVQHLQAAQAPALAFDQQHVGHALLEADLAAQRE